MISLDRKLIKDFLKSMKVDVTDAEYADGEFLMNLGRDLIVLGAELHSKEQKKESIHLEVKSARGDWVFVAGDAYKLFKQAESIQEKFIQWRSSQE